MSWGPNTYPSSWIIFGVDSRGKHQIDKQEDQKFCDTPYCHTEMIKGYRIKNPSKGYKEFIFEQTGNSDNKDYIFFRGFDFFGSLCTTNSQCICPRVTCQMKKFIFFKHLVIFLL